MLGVLTVSLSNSVTILSDGVTILQKNIRQQRSRLNPHKKAVSLILSPPRFQYNNFLILLI